MIDNFSKLGWTVTIKKMLNLNLILFWCTDDDHKNVKKVDAHAGKQSVISKVIDSHLITRVETGSFYASDATVSA